MRLKSTKFMSKLDNKVFYALLDKAKTDFKRRMEGEFFTPLSFAQKGLDYLENTVGKQWWKQGYRLWDMAAGTGNLSYYLPAEAYEYLYLSSLHHEDVDYCKTIFPAATCFQYDYLNDDVELLKSELKNSVSKFLVIIGIDIFDFRKQPQMCFFSAKFVFYAEQKLRKQLPTDFAQIGTVHKRPNFGIADIFFAIAFCPRYLCRRKRRIHQNDPFYFRIG